MYSSMPSAAWSPSRPTDISDSSSPPPASPTSPTRRLRGLSYLRSYTHNHILSRESQNSSTSQRTSTARVTVHPSPPSRASSSTSTTPASAAPTLTTPDIPQPTAPALRRRTADPAPTISSDPDNFVPASDLQPTTSGERRVPANTSGTPSTAPVPSAVGVSLNDQPTPPSDPPASVARTHSAPVGSVPDMPPADGGGASRPRNEAPATANGKDGSHVTPHQLPSIRFTAHQDPRAQRPSLVFSPLARILPSGTEIIKVGRYSERDNQPVQSTNIPSAAPVGFKSKVVSRRHCEFWWSSGRWFIKDVKSSSGTFLNHIRLSSPGTESKPFPVNDGDIVQLGIDFKGGEEMIFRCVKIRIELNKGWQNTPSSFNVQSHKRLQELNSHGKPHTGSSSQDCSICLGPIGPCQSLFVAPCSHTWHYKCIRVIINGPHWPHFICPNCRTVADLEAELDDPYADGEWEEVEATDANSGVQPDLSDPANLARQARQANSSEATDIAPQPTSEEFDQDQTNHRNGDVIETGEDSDIGHGIHDTMEGMSYLNIDEPSPNLLSSSSSRGPEISNATVPPVDIAGRKGASNLPVGASSRLESPGSRSGRGTVRTPSPNGVPSSVTDAVPGSEGPMTPRNDAGPFIFDGGAGRLADISPSQPKPQPAL